MKCPETKEWISFDEAHVDHPAPMTFSVIVTFFIEANNVDLGSVNYLREGLYGNEFSDDTIKEQFRELHKKVGRFRVVRTLAI